MVFDIEFMGEWYLDMKMVCNAIVIGYMGEANEKSCFPYWWYMPVVHFLYLEVFPNIPLLTLYLAISPLIEKCCINKT